MTAKQRAVSQSADNLAVYDPVVRAELAAIIRRALRRAGISPTELHSRGDDRSAA